jgi:hypothetical protein
LDHPDLPVYEENLVPWVKQVHLVQLAVLVKQDMKAGLELLVILEFGGLQDLRGLLESKVKRVILEKQEIKVYLVQLVKLEILGLRVTLDHVDFKDQWVNLDHSERKEHLVYKVLLVLQVKMVYLDQ